MKTKCLFYDNFIKIFYLKYFNKIEYLMIKYKF
jgi:hypothetical protein